MVIGFSLRFAILLLLFHAMVTVVVYATTMPFAPKLALFMLILLSLLYYLVRDVLLALSDSWYEVALDQGGAVIVTRDGSRLSGQVANKTIINSFFVVLGVRLEGHRLPTFRVIFSDAMNTDAFRELRVRLKFI